MQEAIVAVLDHGFKTLKLDLIEADLSPTNLISIRVLEKNNFIGKKRVPDSATIQYSLKNPFI
jgi:RimJ/RimL family protein N-acetyltransferase